CLVNEFHSVYLWPSFGEGLLPRSGSYAGTKVHKVVAAFAGDDLNYCFVDKFHVGYRTLVFKRWKQKSPIER
ncbi:MAG: hypothetical protein ACREUI_09360, partial [Burkholderiales bacterium]